MTSAIRNQIHQICSVTLKRTQQTQSIFKFQASTWPKHSVSVKLASFGYLIKDDGDY